MLKNKPKFVLVLAALFLCCAGIAQAGDGTACHAASATTAAACSGNAATVTGGVYTTGDQNIAGAKTFEGEITFSTSSTTGLNMKIIGAVSALPTTGYASGVFCKYNGIVYYSTQTVVSADSWKALW
jgi:hypothetical protein